MGKIKTKLIKRTSEKLSKTDIEFNEDFENNKKILSDTMPSKKIRNQIAGYLITLKKREKTRFK
jgi:ribosomal protein S17E